MFTIVICLGKSRCRYSWGWVREGGHGRQVQHGHQDWGQLQSFQAAESKLWQRSQYCRKYSQKFYNKIKLYIDRVQNLFELYYFRSNCKRPCFYHRKNVSSYSYSMLILGCNLPNFQFMPILWLFDIVLIYGIYVSLQVQNCFLCFVEPVHLTGKLVGKILLECSKTFHLPSLAI